MNARFLIMIDGVFEAPVFSYVYQVLKNTQISFALHIICWSAFNKSVWYLVLPFVCIRGGPGVNTRRHFVNLKSLVTDVCVTHNV